MDLDSVYNPGFFNEGDTVRTADDYLLGEIAGFLPTRDDPATLLVAPRPDDEDAAGEWRIPVSAIAGYQPGHLYLSATLDEARANGWQG